MGMLLQGPTLFIDGGTKSPPIQILNKESTHIPEFTVCHTTRYDPPLPHDLIHHDARISIINLPAVLTHFNFQKGSKSRKALNYSPLKYKGRHNFSSQRRDQSTPLLSRTQRKKKRRGIYSGQILIYTRIATRSHLIRTARNR